MVPQVPVPLALSGAGPSGEWGLVLVDYAGPTGLLGPSAWPVDPAAALGDMQLCFQPTPCLASTNTHPPLPPCSLPTSFLTPSETLHLCPSLPRAHTLPRLHRNSRSLRVRETLCAPTLFDDKMMLDDQGDFRPGLTTLACRRCGTGLTQHAGANTLNEEVVRC